MAADLDGQMAPVRIEDVKRVVVHIRHRLLSFDVVSRADIPHRRLRPTDQNQKQALGDRRLGEIFFGKLGPGATFFEATMRSLLIQPGDS